MKNGMTMSELETMAQKIASETGADIDQVRQGMRIAMAQIGVAMGTLTMDQANRYLANANVPARIRYLNDPKAN